VIFVTHDPYLALITDRRIVMKNGAVACVLEPDGNEQGIIATVSAMDIFLWDLREKIRGGDMISGSHETQKKIGTPA
jgi:hypothetical protein